MERVSHADIMKLLVSWLPLFDWEIIRGKEGGGSVGEGRGITRRLFISLPSPAR
jgi:hypothetical protein